MDDGGRRAPALTESPAEVDGDDGSDRLDAMFGQRGVHGGAASGAHTQRADAVLPDISRVVR